jgi:hypothetical protein
MAAATAAQNGNKADETLPGIPVDGEFYSANDLTGRSSGSSGTCSATSPATTTRR